MSLAGLVFLANAAFANVNEDLAPARSRLLYICRILKNVKVLHKYWVYDTEVYIRRVEDAEPERITLLVVASGAFSAPNVLSYDKQKQGSFIY